ncbi:MAG: prepilin peptidase [Kiritimatiellaeota bacterium]|nr:prepilin peptidase [Kiritimatiellota bacterium]
MLIPTVFVFVFGACVGSFLNVCIWRIPRGESVVSPPSHCPKCDHRIKWHENLPLLSWLFLRGRCSNCAEPISPRYFCVELLTGALFLFAWFRLFVLRVPNDFILPAFALYAVTIMFMVSTSFIDYDHRLIPNKITYPAMFFGMFWAYLFPAFWQARTSFIALSLSCASAALFGILFSLFAVAGRMFVKKDALGWGDVKYIVAIAALLGPRAAFVTIFAGAIIGSTLGIVLAVVKKRGLKSYIPFGPSLAGGTLIWLAAGPELVSAFWNLTRALHR